MVLHLWQHFTVSALLISSFIICALSRADVVPRDSRIIELDTLPRSAFKNRLRKPRDSDSVGRKDDFVGRKGKFGRSSALATAPDFSILKTADVANADAGRSVLPFEEGKEEEEKEEKGYVFANNRFEKVKREEEVGEEDDNDESDANQRPMPEDSNSKSRGAKKHPGGRPRLAAYSDRLPVTNGESLSAMSTNSATVGPTSSSSLFSADMTPAEIKRAKTYNILVANNLEKRDKLCPICIAAIPLFVKKATPLQIKKIEAFTSQNALGKWGFSNMMKDIKIVRGLYYRGEEQLMTEQSNEICSVIVLDRLIQRIDRQMITSESRLGRGVLKDTDIPTVQRRLELQEYIIENMKANPDEFSCHAGFTDEAYRWTVVFDDILSES